MLFNELIKDRKYSNNHKMFSLENFKDVLERYRMNIEILDNEYLDVLQYLKSIQYFNKRENKYYTFDFNINYNEIDYARDMIDNIVYYYTPLSNIPLFYYLSKRCKKNFINKQLLKLYDILGYLLIIQKPDYDITINIIKCLPDNHFIKNFDISFIENDDYVVNAINVIIDKLKTFKYVINKDVINILTTDLLFLKDKIIINNEK